MPTSRVAVLPEGPMASFLATAVQAGGAELVDANTAEALVWADSGRPDALREVLAAAPDIRWVQLPWAGVEGFARAGIFADLGEGRTWTCAKGIYATPVAELALTLGLAGLRQVVTYARATSWLRPSDRFLHHGRVTVLGGGGITAALLQLLQPFAVATTVVRRSPGPLPGADRTVTTDRLHDALAGADLVVLALALTPETTGIIDAKALAAMEPHAWLVNVARGAHVVTADLVDALADRRIGGAALDVTDPEPLPDGHPLWSMPNCLITPHTANSPEMAKGPLSRRVSENVRRFGAGDPLLGPVDPALGY